MFFSQNPHRQGWQPCNCPSASLEQRPTPQPSPTTSKGNRRSMSLQSGDHQTDGPACHPPALGQQVSAIVFHLKAFGCGALSPSIRLPARLPHLYLLEPRGQLSLKTLCFYDTSRWLTFPHPPPLPGSLYFFLFLSPYLQPYGGSQAKNQIKAAPATATWNPSQVFDLHHSSRQCQILNPLSGSRDRTCILMVISGIRYH